MPDIEDDDFPETAVYWARTGVDEENNPTVDHPEEIPVRWENKQKQLVGPNGVLIGLDAVAYTNRKLVPNSAIWLGSLKDRPGTGFGDEREQLMEVFSVDRIPDIDGRNIRWRVNLRRFKDNLPNLT